ncbi:acylglycerol lipase [Meredithblackwellia eburnea MCA 4105]
MAPTSEAKWLTGPQGLEFYTKTWTPDTETGVKASVCFVHGFIEHIERYNHVFNKFAEEGIAVFGFDGRGFGQTATKSKTPGRTSWAQQFADISHFVQHTSTLHPGVPLYLFGHSMGGALTIAFCTRPTPPAGVELLKGAIASSPLLWQSPGVKAPGLIVSAGSLIGKLSANLTLKAAVNPKDISRDPEVQQAYAVDPLCKPIGTFKGVSDMLLGGQELVAKDWKRWPSDLPLLVVHGGADPTTDPEASKIIIEKIKGNGAKDATVQIFDGYLHEMHNEPDPDKWTEIAALTGWIKSHL